MWFSRGVRRPASIRTGGVGAALVAARAGFMHEFDTGRDKPVPYQFSNDVLTSTSNDHARRGWL